jgi:hypothetical protein
MGSDNKPFQSPIVFQTLFMPVLQAKQRKGELYYSLKEYRKFLENLDIGITVIDGCPNGYSIGAPLVVTDPRKWMLAKIKYGF